MRRERDSSLSNAWKEVFEDKEIQALFNKGWELKETDEKIMEMVRLRITKKNFNARCGTTFHSFKTIAIKSASAGSVSFRNCLKVGGARSTTTTQYTSAASEVEWNIDDDFSIIEDLIYDEIAEAKETERRINFEDENMTNNNEDMDIYLEDNFREAYYKLLAEIGIGIDNDEANDLLEETMEDLVAFNN